MGSKSDLSWGDDNLSQICAENIHCQSKQLMNWHEGQICHVQKEVKSTQSWLSHALYPCENIVSCFLPKSSPLCAHVYNDHIWGLMKGRFLCHCSSTDSLRIRWKLVMTGERMDDEKTPAKGPLKTNALAHLPNATQADFWLQRAHNCQSSGNHQVIACATLCFWIIEVIEGLLVWSVGSSVEVKLDHWYTELVEGLLWPSGAQKTP